MRHVKIKQFVLLIGLLLPAIWCNAEGTNNHDGYSHIAVKEKTVQGVPKGSTINASICAHTLTVSFSENIGQVAVEITTTDGATVNCLSFNHVSYVPELGWTKPTSYYVTFVSKFG